MANKKKQTKEVRLPDFSTQMSKNLFIVTAEITDNNVKFKLEGLERATSIEDLMTVKDLISTVIDNLISYGYTADCGCDECNNEVPLGPCYLG